MAASYQRHVRMRLWSPDIRIVVAATTIARPAVARALPACQGMGDAH